MQIKGDDIFVTADPELIKQNARMTRPPTKAAGGQQQQQQQSSEKGVVIVGGGSGALYGVEGLRESGYAGPIKIISKESYLPIDRTKLSKALIDDPSKVAMRDEGWYKDNKIDLDLGTIVKSVDVEKQTVTTDGGKTIGYDHLLLATGATPTRIPVKGADLGNVFVLRSIDDTKAINAAIAGATTQQPEIAKKAEEAVGLDKPFKPNFVIIGSSFIGMEAALAGSKNANVTVVGMEKVPFERVLGEKVGAALRKHHESKGIQFRLPAELSHFEASDKDSSKVGSVVLKSGEKLPADVVLLGAGVKPVTDYAQGIPGIKIDDKDKSIEVDEQFRVKGIGKDNVFAVGDIAKYPDIKTGQLNRVEHWNTAANAARSVAATIAGKGKPYDKVSIFWSAQSAGQLRYCGTAKASQFKDIHIDGNVDEAKFVAYYAQGDEIVAVASMGRDPVSLRFLREATLLVAWCNERYSS